MGENVGAAARAMKNFGLSELRLIAPMFEWPNDRAQILAIGAGDILERDHAPSPPPRTPWPMCSWCWRPRRAAAM